MALTPEQIAAFQAAAEEIAAGKKESVFAPPQATKDTMRLLDECRRQLGVVYPMECK